jgi:hypothetical protein
MDSLELNAPTVKVNKVTMTITALSFLLQFVVFIKIKIYKQKQQNSVYVLSYVDHIKGLGISSIDNQALPDFATSSFSVALNILLVVFATLGNNIKPVNVNQFPYYLLVYFNYLIANSLLAGSGAIVYFIRHQPLRKAVFREIKLKLLNNF